MPSFEEGEAMALSMVQMSKQASEEAVCVNPQDIMTEKPYGTDEF